jgi:transcriptional regulator with XRE-family HTH domain
MDSKELIKWCEKSGLTQRQLAKILGIHEVTLSRWIIGFSPIPNYLELALAELSRRLDLESEGGKTNSGKEVRTDGSKDKRKKAR